MRMTFPNHVLRGIALLERIDIAASITIAAALFLWMTWH
jgi:hypothetical protein